MAPTVPSGDAQQIHNGALGDVHSQPRSLVVEDSRDPQRPADGASIVTAGLGDWRDGSRFGTTLDALLEHIDCPVLAVRSLSPRSGDDALPYALRLSTVLPATSLAEH